MLASVQSNPSGFSIGVGRPEVLLKAKVRNQTPKSGMGACGVNG
jgi:hypothetical protein